MCAAGGTIIWFHRDLRLADNPALLAAIRHGGPVIPVYIAAPEEEGRWAPGGAARWWLHHSLAELDESLRLLGSRLILRRGPSQKAIRELLEQTGVNAVFWNRRFEPALQARDQQLVADLEKAGLAAHISNGGLLFEPEAISTNDGKPYQVFTAYWRCCLKHSPAHPPVDAPSKIQSPSRWPASLPLAELELLPKIDWAGGFRDAWKPGEIGATKQLWRFIDEALDGYSTDRDQPGIVGTSRLSPHLRFGEISPRQVWFAIERQPSAKNAEMKDSVLRYQSELGWREFAYHLLTHFPHTPEKPLRKEFAAFPWERDRRALHAWQRGQTGYPIVDAGMRELWTTGWMHNRVRMIVASFLVKDLLIRWQDGAAWFWDTLVDADLANNTLGWQWTAGCGADAAPYFRIFNPVLQGEKFDPNGAYVRRWTPELASLSNRWIHKPWEAPPAILREAGIVLGETYPAPIVDHSVARNRALAAFAEIRKK